MLKTPLDKCTQIEIKHRAPDKSVVQNILYIHAIDKYETRIEKCSPHEGRCSPNIPENVLFITAGQQKIEILKIRRALFFV